MQRIEWTPEQWEELEIAAVGQALASPRTNGAWHTAVRHARSVLRNYSTSFFIVTRFLPRAKRDQVEAIYAAVRYPDEIVDSFAWENARKLDALEQWAAHYEAGLAAPCLQEALKAGVPVFAAAFADVVRRNSIPPEHYRDFLRAMQLDVCPRPFANLEDLIESYIYGSAIVVGYFLAYVYGSSSPGEFQRALQSARDLGIALQLTNFVRDVAEDQRRGRVYLPFDLLRAEGIDRVDTTEPAQRPALSRVVQRVAGEAEAYYARAQANIDAFAADTQTAIRACMEVYGRLNTQIRNSREGILHRESVPFRDKFRLLPASKYWRLPVAFLHS